MPLYKHDVCKSCHKHFQRPFPKRQSAASLDEVHCVFPQILAPNSFDDDFISMLRVSHNCPYKANHVINAEITRPDSDVASMKANQKMGIG